MPLCMDYYYSKEKEIEYVIVGDDLGICHVYEFTGENWHACYWNMQGANGHKVHSFDNHVFTCHIPVVKQKIHDVLEKK